MKKKYFIIGAVIILVIAGIGAGKIAYGNSKEVDLPAEEIIIHEDAESTVDHEYHDYRE